MTRPSLDDLLRLDLEDRLRLVHAIWDSISSDPEGFPLTDRERDELDARLDDLAQNPSAQSGWDDVRGRLRRDP